MAKVRVYELAKEFGVESKAVMDQLEGNGRVRTIGILDDRGTSGTAAQGKRFPRRRQISPPKGIRVIRVPGPGRARPRRATARCLAAPGRGPALARCRAPQGARDDRAAAAASTAAAPTSAPDGTANGSAERAVAPDGCRR